MNTVDIVLPVYNEEEVLPSFHASLTDALQTLSDRYRFGICCCSTVRQTARSVSSSDWPIRMSA
jgi:hypothetical protein